MRQTSLAGMAFCIGRGVHTGVRTRLTLRPAPANSGVRFRRVDMVAAGASEADADILINPNTVGDTRLGVTLINAAGARVRTVEHVLAALSGLGVDNALIELDGEEAPILDGSALVFARLIQSAGIRRYAAPRRVWAVRAAVEVRLDEAWARFEPHASGFEIAATVDYADPGVGRQTFQGLIDAELFGAEIAAARTFGFAAEAAALRAQGLALGSGLANTVVLDQGRVANPEGLRFADECVRHKVLDIIGDLAVAGAPIQGRYVVERPGHAVNHRALAALFATPGALEAVTLGIDKDAARSSGAA
ncbi:MAG: UDP-3-O-acyl-N-acetylglucosamine deacetylase [Maricaulaceae bacterium]